MAACEKCRSEASRRSGPYGDLTEMYRKVLEGNDERPCYLDCPKKHPDHYSYTGCPACGYQWGEA